MLHWTWMAVVTILLAVPAAPALETVEQVEKKLIAQWDALKSFTANMNMITISPMATEERKGAVEVVRQGEKSKMRMDMTATMKMPGGQGEMKTKILMVSDGETVTALIDRMGRKMATKTRASGKNNMDFGGKKLFEEMHAKFNLTLVDDAEVDGAKCWVIRADLKESDAAQGPVKYMHYFRKQDGLYAKREGFSKYGQSVEKMTLSDIKINPKIDPKRFELEIPEGVQVMDMTSMGGGGGTP